MEETVRNLSHFFLSHYSKGKEIGRRRRRGNERKEEIRLNVDVALGVYHLAFFLFSFFSREAKARDVGRGRDSTDEAVQTLRRKTH